MTTDATTNTSAASDAAPLTAPPPRMRGALALLLLVPAPSLGVLVSIWLAPGTVGGQVVYGLSKVWIFLLPVVWWRWIERGAWSWSPPRQGGFGVGAVLGVAISAIIIGAYLLFGRAMIDEAQLQSVAGRNGLDRPGRYLMLVAYLILVNSVLEEYVWRWFVFRQCETVMRGWRSAGIIAVVLSAAMFALHHFIALKLQFGWLVTVLGTLGVFIGGATWSWLYLRYRSVWPAYLSHAIVDVAVFVVGWWMLFGMW